MVEIGDLLVKARAEAQDATECFAKNLVGVHTAAQWAELQRFW